MHSEWQKEKNENNETPVQPAKNVEKELLDALEALKNEYAALGKTLEDTKAELNARNDSYVRITAEYENYRKRTAAEKAATYAEAYAGAAELFLPMADALERASELAPEDKGVDALRKQLSDIFGRLGITEIESDGKPFDPSCTMPFSTRTTKRSPKAPWCRPSSAATGWATR